MLDGHIEEYTDGPDQGATCRVLKMLVVLSIQTGIKNKDLQSAIGCSRATVKRIINEARNKYEVEIEYARGNEDNKDGGYQIKSWGVFQREKVLQKYGELAVHQY